jgi:hypothetical protein
VNPQYTTVAARAGHRCEYCHAPEAVFNLPFEVEHIIPRNHGGSDDDLNLALACRSCNVFKSDRVEIAEGESEAFRLFDPRRDHWREHFEVLENGTLQGKTTAGRVTAEQLRMNSPAQMAARLHWITLGLFP